MTWGYILFIGTVIVTIFGTKWLFEREDRKYRKQGYLNKYDTDYNRHNNRNRW
jgi:hypothetical protein